MSDIQALNSAQQSSQMRTQTAFTLQALKQSAQADQTIAAMLEKNARALAQASQQQAGTGGISIYV